MNSSPKQNRVQSRLNRRTYGYNRIIWHYKANGVHIMDDILNVRVSGWELFDEHRKN